MRIEPCKERSPAEGGDSLYSSLPTSALPAANISRHRRSPVLWLSALALVAACCLASSEAAAQPVWDATSANQQPASEQGPVASSQPAETPTSQPAAPPETVTKPPALDTATDGLGPTATELQGKTIQDRMAQIQAATDLPETTKTEILGLYRQALDQLSVALNWAAKIEEYRATRERAPDLLAEISARLEQATRRASPPPTSQPATTSAPTATTSQPVTLVSPEDSLDTLKRKLADKEATLHTAQKALENLEEEAKNRTARRTTVPELASDANKRLEEITKNLAAPAVTGISPQVALARRTLLLAQKAAVQQEIRAYEEELRSYDAYDAILTARRQEMLLTVNTTQSEVNTWNKMVEERRLAEIDEKQRLAKEPSKQEPGPIRALLKENSALADEWATVGKRIKDLNSELDQVRSQREIWRKDFTEKQTLLDEDTDIESGLIGLNLRKIRSDLIDLGWHERSADVLMREAAKATARAFEIGGDPLLVAGAEPQVAAAIQMLKDEDANFNQEETERRIRQILAARSETLKNLSADYKTYTKKLGELRLEKSTLLTLAESYVQFIDQHALWMRGAPPIYTTRLPSHWRKDMTNVIIVGQSLIIDAAYHPGVYLFIVLFVTALFICRPPLQSALRNMSQRVSRPFSDSYSLTLKAALYTITRSLPWPLLMWLLAWRIPEAVDIQKVEACKLADAIGAGLLATSVMSFALTLLRETLRPKSLAETHFRWGSAAVRLARRNVTWLLAVALPCTFVIYATERYTDNFWRVSIGRLAFIAGMIALCVFCHRILRPTTGMLAEYLQRNKNSWPYHLRHVWYGGVLATPIVLAVISAVGYHYAGVALAQRLVFTVWLGVGLTLLCAMLERWVFVVQRKLAIEKAKKKRAAAIEAREEDPESAGEVPDIEESALSLVHIGDQTKRLLRTTGVFGMMIGMWIIWSNMLPALSFMNDVQLWSYTVSATESTSGEPVTGIETGTTPTTSTPPPATHQVEHITLAHVAMAIIITIATFVLARNIPGLLEIAFLQRLPLDAGARYAMSTLARYTIIVVGVIATFSSIGIGWSKVQWLVAAMTVGLGFGLQEIFGNFVAGVILLFERPIRLGDVVTVGDISGTVSRIRIRATTITDWDRKELVIPNKEFVTGQVFNWTLSDQILRLVVRVGIAYGSDVDRAREVLMDIATHNEHVLEQPKPRVWFWEFGDSSLNFEVRVFAKDLDEWVFARDSLHRQIDAAFRKAGIEIAFPQRDIHIRSIQQALPLRHENPSQDAGGAFKTTP